MNIGIILIFYLLGFLRCEAYNPHDRSKDPGKSVEETAKKSSGLLTTILTSLVSNKAQPNMDPDNHYSRILEGNVNNYFPGKLKPTPNNWFQILPTPVVTNDVSLKTVVGCVIASLGERLIKQIETEALDHHGRQEVRLQWAEQRLSEFIQFLKRAICTFELVDKKKSSYINHSEYTTFITVIQDYLRVGKYLYKLAVSAYRQVSDNFQDGELNSISCSQNNEHRGCSSDVVGILKQLRCFSNCRQTNHCRNKITKLRKMLRRARRMIINSIFRLKRE